MSKLRVRQFMLPPGGSLRSSGDGPSPSFHLGETRTTCKNGDAGALLGGGLGLPAAALTSLNSATC